MKNNTFNPWIKISSFSCLSGQTSGVEISSNFYFRSFQSSVYEPEKIFTEPKLLTPEQQTLIKEKRSKINFKTLKNEYYDSNVIDGGTDTFQITEENFSKTIEETNFSWKGTEYEPLAQFIHYLYDLSYTENEKNRDYNDSILDK